MLVYYFFFFFGGGSAFLKNTSFCGGKGNAECLAEAEGLRMFLFLGARKFVSKTVKRLLYHWADYV